MNENALTLKLNLLLKNMPYGVLAEDENRKIANVNKKFCEMFQISAEPEQLLGADCSQSAQQNKHFFKDEEDFVTRIDEILTYKQPVRGDELLLKDGSIWERDYEPLYESEKFIGNLWIYRDVTEEKKRAITIEKQNEDLQRINNFMMDREVKMKALKDKIALLEGKEPEDV